MGSGAKLQVKVLVLENDAASAQWLREAFDHHGLVGVKAQAVNLANVLQSRVDLGAVFLADDFIGQPNQTLDLACELNRLRPELPIFLRSKVANVALSPAQRRAVRHIYTCDERDSLDAAIHGALFSLVYPEALVSGIAQLTTASLQGQFRGVDVLVDPPFIVRDRLIFGEVYSLIPLESSWCRGTMMMQIEERSLKRLVTHQLGEVESDQRDSIRAINHVFAETTNLVWGAFKNRFIAHESHSAAQFTQVPTVINHAQRYISFGSEDPQLCFRYLLTIPDASPVELHQRFVFNLSWSPELFRENTVAAEALIDSGELELF